MNYGDGVFFFLRSKMLFTATTTNGGTVCMCEWFSPYGRADTYVWVCVVAFVKWMMMIVQTVAAERHEYTVIWRTQDCSGELYGFFKMLSALKLSCSAEKQLFDLCWLCKYFLGRNTLCVSFLRKSFKLKQRDCL